eukprot:CAMPEP_0196744012 /NCGR_PEP_ID=MMETSP1091-20130531/55547_1 /TAXON_ID=302021 /ORGANISM="Rhodomonas sp., Strain CCMP768" /LENGTH=146 /DNA_ID=CAMNT_0042090479 /DNA_START=156 /DNA_END=597 /DNA_ORIENTATION=-
MMSLLHALHALPLPCVRLVSRGTCIRSVVQRQNSGVRAADISKVGDDVATCIARIGPTCGSGCSALHSMLGSKPLEPGGDSEKQQWRSESLPSDTLGADMDDEASEKHEKSTSVCAHDESSGASNVEGGSPTTSSSSSAGPGAAAK